MSAAPMTVLITGASGGIGEAFAQLLAAEGHALVLAARRQSELDRVAAAISAKHRVSVTVVACDLAKADGVAALADGLERRSIMPDVIVNNAGYGLMGKAAEIGREGQLGMIDLNIRALSDLCFRYLPGMIARKRGGIVNLASTAGFMAGPGMAVYFASKNYVLALSDALHHETQGTGVTVMSLCPGPVSTGFQARAGLKNMKRGSGNLMTPEEVAKAGWDGFRAGKRCVVPGAINIASGLAGRLLPRGLSLAIARQWAKGAAGR